ncbi:MAG: Rieske (2Fe-2S) protein [Rhodospirillales bacterium]
MTVTEICPLDALEDGGAKGFNLDIDGERTAVFLIRQGDAVRAYVNECPHILVPLNARPDAFLSPDGARIMCSNHRAEFLIDDGRCVSGPCIGDRLKVLPVGVLDGRVFLISG